MSQSPWEAIVARKREQVAAALPAEWRLPQHLLDEIRQDPTANVLGVPAECGLLTPREIEITQDHDAVALVAKLASNRFTASEVTTAFCKRAAIATQLVRSERV
jgi:amidase